MNEKLNNFIMQKQNDFLNNNNFSPLSVNSAGVPIQGLI
jgi:hypothetical protein